MILYFDTSALIKKYVNENGSCEVITLWNKSDLIVTSSVAFAEFLSALNRKRREGNISESDYYSVIQDFKNDWNGFLRIEVSDRLNNLIEQLTKEYYLRGIVTRNFYRKVHKDALCSLS